MLEKQHQKILSTANKFNHQSSIL